MFRIVNKFIVLDFMNFEANVACNLHIIIIKIHHKWPQEII